MIGTILLVIGIVIYLFLAVAFTMGFSHYCCLTYGGYHFTFWSIMAGLFFPITLIITWRYRR